MNLGSAEGDLLLSPPVTVLDCAHTTSGMETLVAKANPSIKVRKYFSMLALSATWKKRFSL